MKTLTEKVVQNFWKKVDKSGPVPAHRPELGNCWVWKNKRTDARYGSFWDGEKLTVAHRVSYRIHLGEVPDGKDVCHACDNTWCVRPDHLWAGTKSENIRDAIAKGRYKFVQGTVNDQKGEKHWNCKIKSSDIHKIFNLKRDGLNQTQIAKLFNVGQDQISRILTGNRRKSDIGRLAALSA